MKKTLSRRGGDRVRGAIGIRWENSKEESEKGGY